MAKKILFIYYQNIKQGGISKSMANLSKDLAETGYEITLLFLREEHQDFFPISPKVKKLYLNTFDTRQFRWAGKIRKNKIFKSKTENIAHYLYDLGCYFSTTKWLKENHKDYDTIITCWYKLSTYATFHREIAKKTIAWEHINYKTGGILYFNLLRKRYQELKGIICLTQDSAKHYRIINKQTAVIPNIIGDNFENNDSKIGDKENIIFLAGRLDPEKNVDGFLNIIKSTKIPPDWRILIAGNGWLEEKLKKKKNELNLQNVEFLGSLTFDKMLQIYAKSKIFCMTSLVEGLPTVLIEAMFFGNALIAYDCPTGPSEIINENNGYLIPLNDENLFKNKLEILVNDKEKLQNLMISSKNESEKWKKSEIIEKWKKILA